MGSIEQTYAIGKTQITSVDLSNIVEIEYPLEGSTNIVGELVKMGADTRYVRGMSYIFADSGTDFVIAATLLASANIVGDLLVGVVYLEGQTSGDTSTEVIFGAIGQGHSDGSTDVTADLVREREDAATVKGLDIISSLQEFDRAEEFTFTSATPVLRWRESFSGYDTYVVVGSAEIEYGEGRQFEFDESEVLGDTTIAPELSGVFSLAAEIGGSAYVAIAIDEYGEVVGKAALNWIDVYAHNPQLSANIGGTSSVSASTSTLRVIGVAQIISDNHPFLINGPEEEYDGPTFGPAVHIYDFHYSISANEVYTSLPILSGAIFGTTTLAVELSVKKPISANIGGYTTISKVKLDNTYTRYHEDAGDVFTVCTSATRPGSPSLGDTIYETDTEKTYMWDGLNWVPSNPDGRYFSSLTGPTGGGVYK